jgi:alkylation response protein AidB-like acyl-CoA dehydrogenase
MTVTAPGSPTQLRGALSDWLRAHGEEHAAARAENEPVAIEDAMRVDRVFQRALWDAGFTRHGWPESVGGTGGSAELRATIYEHLSLEGYRIPLPLSTLEVLGPVMVQVAPDLCVRFLGACIRGDEVWCQGFSEPEAGSDLAALRCRAVPDGDGWRVTGQKLWSSFGSMSDKSAALVRTGPEGHRGISMFLIDLDSPGIEVRSTRASSDRNEFAETFFDEVFVPGDRVVGEVNAGWGIAMTLLQWERGMYAWQRQVVLHARLAEIARALPHPTPAQARAIADAWVRVTALRSAAARTVRRLAAGENPGPEISVDKVLLATTEQAVEDLFRVLDPAGFVLGETDRDALHRSDWFYARMATIYGGAIEIQRSIIAERVLRLPRAGGR